MAGGMKLCIRCLTAPLGRRNKSGYCVSCWPKVGWNLMRADPTFEAKRVKGINDKIARDPEYRERLKKRMAIATALPQATEARRRSAIEQRIWEIGSKYVPAGSPGRIKAGAKMSETRLSWCPRELRDEYRRLIRSSRIPAVEAKEMILAQHERDMAKFRARLIAEAA